MSNLSLRNGLTDVYKRQVWAFALFAKLLHPFPCLGVYDRLVAVSYTHLKLLRQAMDDYESKKFIAKSENITVGELLRCV